MKNGKHVEFNCLDDVCGKPVQFKLLEIETSPIIRCPNCGKEYNLNGNFHKKLKKFESLIYAIKDAEEILGDTNVAVNYRNHEIRIPYRLLLTRMNTLLTMNIGGKKVELRFRVEPLGMEE